MPGESPSTWVCSVTSDPTHFCVHETGQQHLALLRAFCWFMFAQGGWSNLGIRHTFTKYKTKLLSDLG